MKVRFGPHDLDLPSGELGVLRDSNDLVGDADAMRARLNEDGYLLLRGLIDRDVVLRGRRTVLEYLDEHEGLQPGTPLLEGIMVPGSREMTLVRPRDITHHPDVLAVLESPRLFGLYETLFDAPARTYDYKWLRAVGRQKHTPAHMDAVYVGRGSPDVKTCWIPIGDLPAELGPLAICVGSHRMEAYARMRETYGRMDVDRDHVDGWLADDPMHFVKHYGGQWCTTEFRAGDVLTFGLHTLHASLTNTTLRYRISADVRYQPAHHAIDDRFIGPAATAGAGPGENAIPMAQKKAEWGLV